MYIATEQEECSPGCIRSITETGRAYCCTQLRRDGVEMDGQKACAIHFYISQ
jgi:hypothetical protein